MAISMDDRGKAFESKWAHDAELRFEVEARRNRLLGAWAAGKKGLSGEAAEQFILTLSSEGIGKRSSAYDYRRTGRGGQGLLAQDMTKKGGRLVAAFPVEQTDGLLLVTDQGQLIRCPVGQIRIAARNTQGVIVFRTAQDEHVVSVERLADAGGGEDEVAAEGDEAPEAPAS